MKKFRETGAIGSLLDEYEKAIFELQVLLNTISEEELVAVVDMETQDTDCISIQTILTHIIKAGYNYAIYIRQHLGEQVELAKLEPLASVDAYQDGITAMFSYNVTLFVDYPDMILEEHDATKRMDVSWGQSYDAEQLMEHAIVHILRHRRQIERFLLQLRA